jgi:two-component system sensor histidine kinase AlgZ
VFSAGVDDRPVWHMANIDPFTLDLFIYFALLAWSHARDFAAWYEERGLAAARTEAAIARAHWQTLALELHPQFLLAALGAAAELTRSDAARAERVVERLADLLRATLDAPSRGERSVRDELAILGGCLELHREATGGSAALECVVEAKTLDALVPSGAFHQAVDRVLARAALDPTGSMRVRVETRRRAGATELVVRSGAPAPVAAPATATATAATPPAQRARSSA